MVKTLSQVSRRPDIEKFKRLGVDEINAGTVAQRPRMLPSDMSQIACRQWV